MDLSALSFKDICDCGFIISELIEYQGDDKKQQEVVDLAQKILKPALLPYVQYGYEQKLLLMAVEEAQTKYPLIEILDKLK